jgi:UDP-N-acetylglucosamine--N-acetylmuramyl-(pentapeptide) pyrophosphoryl-undecaprenol N-acetylglucosamine transferase
MNVIVTGGGTGGHVYPALEIGRELKQHGARVTVLGSRRGMEGPASERAGFPFAAYDAQPLYSLRTRRGWQSLVALLRAIPEATRLLAESKAERVVSTGGYSAAPCLYAARKARLPMVLHESNSIPGRTHRLFAGHAQAFTYVFQTTREHAPLHADRTGQPVRASLVEAAAQTNPGREVLVVGGSQGSAFLNDFVPQVVAHLPGDVTVWHSVGPGNFDALSPRPRPDTYRIVPYFDANEMAARYQSAGVALARSGGTLAEFALFALPSVLVPLPNSADHHQGFNALEFARIGAADVRWQPNSPPWRSVPEARASEVAARLMDWLDNAEKRAVAAQALREWYVPNAAAKISHHVLNAGPR